MGHNVSVIKLELLLGIAVLAMWVFCLVDLLGTRDDQVRGLPKLGWFVVVLLFPLLGSVLWLVAGRPRPAARPRSYERPAPEFPEYDRPGRAAAGSPEQDAAFLRQVRERAEEQRRRYDRQRRAEQQAEEQRAAERRARRDDASAEGSAASAPEGPVGEPSDGGDEG